MNSFAPRVRASLGRGLAAVLGLVALAGCSVFLRDTPAPIATRTTLMAPPGRTSTLVVFLPGRGDSMDDLVGNGLIETLREAGVRADAVVVDAHLGYYLNKTAVERLRADVLLPARAQGYRRIVLVGVSLGGLGALLTERDFPGSVDALVLFAPFLGGKERFFDGIDAAGGLQAWVRGRDPLAGSIEEQIWTFLALKTSDLPPTWLLAGAEDRYARGQRRFATLLPLDHVNTIPGGHDWPVWRALWRDVCFHGDVFRSERP